MGNFTFMPNEGYPMETKFDINVTGWSDPEGSDMKYHL